MKTFEYPVIEVIAFTAESIMDASNPINPPENDNPNGTPWN